MATSPFPTLHGGQHDAKYVAFELLLRAAFVADEILGFMLEPARTNNGKLVLLNRVKEEEWLKRYTGV